MERTFVGITGASGHAYAEALVRRLAELGEAVDLVVTRAGARVLEHELGVRVGERGDLERATLASWLGPPVAERVRSFPTDAIDAPPASGTARTRAVVLCPCSMGTLARVRAGFSSNLVERAADVALKEGRRLVVVPREAPLSEIHLENLLALARLGAVVLPASPGFYHRPASIAELVEHLVGKILDRIGVEHGGKRWGEGEPAGDPGVEPPARAQGGASA